MGIQIFLTGLILFTIAITIIKYGPSPKNVSMWIQFIVMVICFFGGLASIVVGLLMWVWDF